MSEEGVEASGRSHLMVLMEKGRGEVDGVEVLGFMTKGIIQQRPRAKA